MTTKLAQILDRIDALARASVPAGTGVFRDRPDAQSLEEAPAVNTLVREVQTEPFSVEMDLHQAQIELRFYVRSEPGSPAVEAMHGPVHAAIATDAALSALVESRRLTDSTFDLTEADTTSLIKAVRYRFTYLIPSQTL